MTFARALTPPGDVMVRRRPTRSWRGTFEALSIGRWLEPLVLDIVSSSVLAASGRRACTTGSGGAERLLRASRHAPARIHCGVLGVSRVSAGCSRDDRLQFAAGRADGEGGTDGTFQRYEDFAYTDGWATAIPLEYRGLGTIRRSLSPKDLRLVPCVGTSTGRRGRRRAGCDHEADAEDGEFRLRPHALLPAPG